MYIEIKFNNFNVIGCCVRLVIYLMASLTAKYNN